MADKLVLTRPRAIFAVKETRFALMHRDEFGEDDLIIGCEPKLAEKIAASGIEIEGGRIAPAGAKARLRLEAIPDTTDRLHAFRLFAGPEVMGTISICDAARICRAGAGKIDVDPDLDFVRLRMEIDLRKMRGELESEEEISNLRLSMARAPHIAEHASVRLIITQGRDNKIWLKDREDVTLYGKSSVRNIELMELTVEQAFSLTDIPKEWTRRRAPKNMVPQRLKIDIIAGDPADHEETHGELMIGSGDDWTALRKLTLEHAHILSTYAKEVDAPDVDWDALFKARQEMRDNIPLKVLQSDIDRAEKELKNHLEDPEVMDNSEKSSIMEP